jgi:hypothetical protein
MKTIRTLLAAAAALSLVTAPAHAGSWTATGLSSFGNLNLDGSATATYSGGIFTFNKPSGSNRAEAHGANGVTITQGETYTINWEFKLSSTVNNNAIFQWKAYGSPMVQNYPLVLKMINNQLVLQYTPPNSSSIQVTHTTISANTWYSIKVVIFVQNSTSGYISLWLNGAPIVTTYHCDSWDGDQIDPKWGIYGATSTSVNDQIRNLSMSWGSGGGGGGGTTVSFEAENLAVSNSGTGTSVQTDANSSNGQWISLNATGTGSWMEFTTGTVNAGTYSVSMMWKGNNSRGITDFFVDGAQVGGTLDQYASGQTYPTTTFGNVTFGSSGTHKIRMHVTGKNSSSAGYVLSADKFTFTAQ